jgi:adenosine deaminase
MRNQLITFLDGIPKVELHIHLEGSIPIETLWELIKKYNGDKQIEHIDKLRKKFIFTDFHHFLDTWVWKDQFIREYDDFEFFADSVAADLKSQNIIYAELHFTPLGYEDKNLETGKVVESIKKGFSKHSKDITVFMIADLCRNSDLKTAERNLDIIIEMKDPFVAGIGLGGDEKNYPPSLFKGCFEKAKLNSLMTTAHAGEAAGSESIWSAVKDLKIDRIGHGTRAYEDEYLLEYLNEKQLHIEMCPLSNLRTKVVHAIEDHPVKKYFDMGLNISVNTDDPKMFNNTLYEEYSSLVENFGFTESDIKKLISNAIKSSWCGSDKKIEMLKKLD